MMAHIIDFASNYFSKLAYFYGYHVVERFVGHGIGTMLHSEPLILHHGENFLDIFLFLSTLLFSTYLTIDIMICHSIE